MNKPISRIQRLVIIHAHEYFHDLDKLKELSDEYQRLFNSDLKEDWLKIKKVANDFFALKLDTNKVTEEKTEYWYGVRTSFAGVNSYPEFISDLNSMNIKFITNVLVSDRYDKLKVFDSRIPDDILEDINAKYWPDIQLFEITDEDYIKDVKERVKYHDSQSV